MYIFQKNRLYLYIKYIYNINYMNINIDMQIFSIYTVCVCIYIYINTQKCDAFIAAIVSNVRITAGACLVTHVRHEHMRNLVKAAIKFTCLYISISNATYVNMNLLAAIMSLIALFRAKYCIYIG